MSATVDPETAYRPLPWALSLISCGILLYEILLTRIFSVVFLHHFAYAALYLLALLYATRLLAFGAGAAPASTE